MEELLSDFFSFVSRRKKGKPGKRSILNKQQGLLTESKNAGNFRRTCTNVHTYIAHFSAKTNRLVSNQECIKSKVGNLEARNKKIANKMLAFWGVECRVAVQ